jgi:hypothetical protein
MAWFLLYEDFSPKILFYVTATICGNIPAKGKLFISGRNLYL